MMDTAPIRRGRPRPYAGRVFAEYWTPGIIRSMWIVSLVGGILLPFLVAWGYFAFGDDPSANEAFLVFVAAVPVAILLVFGVRILLETVSLFFDVLAEIKDFRYDFDDARGEFSCAASPGDGVRA